ncbi:MAG TPA: hypothetical protein VKK31_02620 [Thermoanaerobaculia bacterium]|nr:hypothetical protein [Thermoanaerobaculia bacterium]
MAKENGRLPREPDQGFVGRLVPDPASPPELTLLVGYPGASPEEGHARLYASADLSRWWEIPEEDVLHRQAVPNDFLGAEILWIRRDKQPVLNSRRPDFDMNTYTLTFPYCGLTLQQPPTISGLNCGTGPVQQQPYTAQGGAAALPPTFFGTCTIPPVTTGCTYGAAQGQGTHPPQTAPPPPTTNCFAQAVPFYPVQHQPFTIAGFNCGTGPVQQQPYTAQGGAAALQPTFFGVCTIPPVTTGCTYGGAQGHPQTMITVVYPNTQDQPCFQQTWVRPHTQDCGTSPVAQGAAAPQQAQVLPTLGPWPTIPPVTFCCPR